MSHAFYVRWKLGEPREGAVLAKLHVDSPAIDMPCTQCGELLGDGRPVQLYALGPGDVDSVVRHERGWWYSALAALVHVDCAPDLPQRDEQGRL